jgi:hypothetical protein
VAHKTLRSQNPKPLPKIKKNLGGNMAVEKIDPDQSLMMRRDAENQPTAA